MGRTRNEEGGGRSRGRQRRTREEERLFLSSSQKKEVKKNPPPKEQRLSGGAGRARTWFLAASPTRRSVSVKATYEGVVRLPWSLAMISTLAMRRERGGGRRL